MAGLGGNAFEDWRFFHLLLVAHFFLLARLRGLLF